MIAVHHASAYKKGGQLTNVPHDLHIENGQASMMYVGHEPWHRLGKKLDRPATAEEAIRAANLDWEVIKRPLRAVDERGFSCRVKNTFAVVPEHKWGDADCPVFGIVGSNYTPLQNRDAFRFFDPIVGEGKAVYHTAGALGKGERIWILAKLPSEICVAEDDITEKYLLLSNTHDGTSSVQIKFTPIRVVCQNTLTMALRNGPTIRAAHMPDIKRRLEFARRSLNLINTRYDAIETEFKRMVTVAMDQGRLAEYHKRVFPLPAGEDERAIERVYEQRARATWLFENGRGNRLTKVAGTLWAAYNGVTDMVDHRVTNRTAVRKLEFIWFGDGARLKARAFDVAKSFV